MGLGCDSVAGWRGVALGASVSEGVTYLTTEAWLELQAVLVAPAAAVPAMVELLRRVREAEGV